MSRSYNIFLGVNDGSQPSSSTKELSSSPLTFPYHYVGDVECRVGDWELNQEDDAAMLRAAHSVCVVAWHMQARGKVRKGADHRRFGHPSAPRRLKQHQRHQSGFTLDHA
uniref:Uncharacterized protein n=1 Tax=Plectus sambesii TaxID=2011161 RepID=A0A914XRL3_9BILA